MAVNNDSAWHIGESTGQLSNKAKGRGQDIWAGSRENSEVSAVLAPATQSACT